MHLKRLLSWWFILQIVLPFTAPLQTVDLHDLLGTRSHHSAPAAPESSTTPTVSEGSAAGAFVSVLAPTVLDASTSAAAVSDLAIRRLLASAFSLSPAPPVQRSVLRL